MSEPTNDDIKHVADLARDKEDQEGLIATLEECLREAKSRLSVIESVELPMAMEDLGIESFTLSNGRKVTVEQVYSARINKDCEVAAFEWLRENGEGDLITTRQVCNVHHSTLNAWVKRRYQAGTGVEIPDDLFKPYVGTKAVIR